MAVFVMDASVALAWCFEDEATNWTEAFLERLRQGDRIIVPAHWPTEVANALLIAARRRRIKPEQPQALWDELGRLPIDIEPALSTARGKDVLALGEKHNLTVYDAACLELARRYQLPLGTLDADLRKAAQAEGLLLL
jgi:predicted nucleic acid-binding protein